MTLHPRLTCATVALVKRFETFQPVAEPTPDGGWSVGYGHTASAREGARVSPADAEALLIYDLDRAARAVERAVFAPVTQGQFEALTALCFNLSEPAFLRSSALARVNAGAELDAADEIERWRQAELGAGTQVVDALVRRRAAEKAHFLDLADHTATWPSAQHRPLATAGGETPDPPTAVECPASAALSAANGVQARLRRLIPDEEVPATSPHADVSIPADIPQPSQDEAATAPQLSAVVSAHEDSEPVAWEPTPPPFDPPATPPLDAPPVTGSPEPTAAPAPETDEAAPPATFGSPSAGRPRSSRLPYALAGLVGVVLFVAGAAMILAGRPGLFNLGLGIVGVLLAVTGLYGVLGAPRASADLRPATPEPFHPEAVDTK